MSCCLRFLVCSGIIVLSVSCYRSTSIPLPAYTPASFREDITKLVSEQRYSDAVHYLSSAEPARQAQYDEEGYLAIAEDLIFLPGVESKIDYDRDRDWEIPGTSDVLQDEEWQQAATEFAKRYNQVRLSESQ